MPEEPNIQELLGIAERPPMPAPTMQYRPPSVNQKVLALEARLNNLESLIREGFNRLQQQNTPVNTPIDNTALLLKTFSEIEANSQERAQANASAQLALTKELLTMALDMRSGQVSEAAQMVEAVGTVAPVVASAIKDAFAKPSSPPPAPPSLTTGTADTKKEGGIPR